MQYIDFDNELNDKQYVAVSTENQHVRVIAGAGSGKTRVLTYRIAYLINKFHVFPWTILAITFTNKVAKEMKERINRMIPGIDKDLTIKTFHSFAAYFLRREIEVIGFPKSFTILDEEDQEKIIKDIVSEMGYKRSDKIVGKAISYISSCKLKEKYPDDIHIVTPKFENEKECLEIYTRYEENKNKCLCLDFDDLLLKSNYILENYPDIRNRWQNRIDHILIDEFQDTNDVEYKFINLLIKNTTSLYVVGDPDQTIYTWRGANPNIILDIEKRYPLMETIILNQNYRSTQIILNSANKLISNNKMRVHKDLFSTKNGGDKIVVKGNMASRSEAEYVAREIKLLVETKGYKYKDFAILYRSNYITLDFETAFTGKKIPYVIYGGQKFYQRMEIKDVLAYFHLIINPKDDVSFDRIVNVPKRNIGETTTNLLKFEANEAKKSLYEYARDVKEEDTQLSKKILNSLKTMITVVDTTRDNINKSDEVFVKHLEELIWSIGYQDYLLKYDDKSDERIENVKQLFADIRHFLKNDPEATFSDYLQNVSLLSAQDDIVDGDRVQMMTVHTAKGLEFPIVFLVRFNNNIFPNQRAMLEGGFKAMEEERRLAYVGMTRAKEKLYLTYACDYSYVLGGMLTPSQFIKESGNANSNEANDYNPFRKSNPTEYHFDDEPKKRQSFNIDEPIVQDFNQVPVDEIDWKVGDIVNHTKFGTGVVIDVDGDGILTVNFEKYGNKMIMGNHPFVSKGGHEA